MMLTRIATPESNRPKARRIPLRVVLSAILPTLPPAEFDQLVVSIRRYGVRVPLLVAPVPGEPDAVVIIDGHERFRAAQVAGVKLGGIPFEVISVPEPDRFRYAVELNAHRRHLTRQQRRELLERVFRADPAQSTREIADLCKVPQTAAARAKRKVLGESNDSPAVTKGKDGKFYPSVFVKGDRQVADIAPKLERVAGNLSGVVASRRVRQDASSAELEQLNRGPLAKKDAVIRVLLSDFRKVEKIVGDLTGTVDCLMGDPPWLGSEAAIREPFAQFAARTLKEGGILASYTGQFLAYDWYDAFRKAGLSYVMTVIAVNFVTLKEDGSVAFGGSTKANGRARNCYREVLIFVKGRSSRDFAPARLLDDLICVQQRKRRDHTKNWAQPLGEAEYLLSKLTKPGSLIVDPTCGSGTSGLATAHLGQGRKYIGCDTSRTEVAKARRDVNRVLKERRKLASA
jgi:hypothetical protein